MAQTACMLSHVNIFISLWLYSYLYVYVYVFLPFLSFFLYFLLNAFLPASFPFLFHILLHVFSCVAPSFLAAYILVFLSFDVSTFHVFVLPVVERPKDSHGSNCEDIYTSSVSEEALKSAVMLLARA